MFILNNEKSEIVLKSASAYIMMQQGGEYAFPSVVEEGPTDMLCMNLSSAKEYASQNKIRSFSGAFSYHEYNAYHQCLYEGKIDAGDHAVLLSTGTLIDMSDSCLVFVNLSEDEAWHMMLDIAEKHMSSVQGKGNLETLQDFIRFAQEKCGIEPEPVKKKGGLFGFLHRKK